MKRVVEQTASKGVHFSNEWFSNNFKYIFYKYLIAMIELRHGRDRRMELVYVQSLC